MEALPLPGFRIASVLQLFAFVFLHCLNLFFLQVIVLNLLRWRYEKENDCFVQCDNCSVSDYIFLYVFLCHVAHGTYRFLGTCYPEDDHSYLFTQDVHRENQESGQVMFRLFPRMNRMLFQYREGGYGPMTVTLKRVTTTPEGRALFASFCRFRQEKTE